MAVVTSEEETEPDVDAPFRAMADSAPTPVWITDAGGKLTFANRAFVELTGRSGTDLLGDAWIMLIHPDDLAGVAERRAHAWRNNFEPYEFVARFLDADGAYRWMRASAQPRFAERGDFQGYVGMAVDDTARRRTLSELRESEMRLRMIQRAAQIASFEWNFTTGQIFRTPEYFDLHGLPADVTAQGQYDDV